MDTIRSKKCDSNKSFNKNLPDETARQIPTTVLVDETPIIEAMADHDRQHPPTGNAFGRDIERRPTARSHFTEDEKNLIYEAKERYNYSYDKIAEELGCHKSSAQAVYLKLQYKPTRDVRMQMWNLANNRLDNYMVRTEQVWDGLMEPIHEPDWSKFDRNPMAYAQAFQAYNRAKSDQAKNKISTIQRLESINNRKVQLNGLDMPKQIEVTHNHTLIEKVKAKLAEKESHVAELTEEIIDAEVFDDIPDETADEMPDETAG